MKMEKSFKSDKIKSLTLILKRWTDVVEKYVNYFDRDIPWWYNERATLSLFAAAVWLEKGIALEEYQTTKKIHKKEYQGRCDLYFTTNTGEQDFSCEVKQAWCLIGRTAKKGVDTANSALQEACHDAKMLTKEADRKLGLCFAVPYLPLRDEPYVSDQFQTWFTEVQALNFDCIAWCFFKDKNYFLSPGKYYYPGVVLMVKEA